MGKLVNRVFWTQKWSTFANCFMYWKKYSKANLRFRGYPDLRNVIITSKWSIWHLIEKCNPILVFPRPSDNGQILTILHQVFVPPCRNVGQLDFADPIHSGTLPYPISTIIHHHHNHFSIFITCSSWEISENTSAKWTRNQRSVSPFSSSYQVKYNKILNIEYIAK